MGLPDRTGAILTDEQKQHMQQARKKAKLLVDKLYKQEYSTDVEALWKSLG